MTVRWLTILMVLVFTMPANAESRAEAMCGEDPYAQRLAELIINDPEQQRPRLRCNDTLVQVATRKAQEMAEMGLVSHLGESDPNTRLRSAGYALPTYYPLIGANQVEAVAGGYATPEAAWQAFKGSQEHRSHVLGEHPFYREQDEIGVGFYRKWSSPHVDYWAIYLARRELTAAR